MVRALASRCCGLGSIPIHGVTCAIPCLSLIRWFSSLLREFSSYFPPKSFPPVSLPPQKPTCKIPIRPEYSGQEESPRGMSIA